VHGAFNIYDAMDQAARDAGAGASRTGHQKTPFVMHKRNFRRWLVVMEAETFFKFLSGELPPEEALSREQGAGVKVRAARAMRERKDRIWGRSGMRPYQGSFG